MEEMCRVRYGEGGGASMTSPRKHFSKSPGVHQPEASTHLCHLPPAQTCSSPWAKPSDTPLPPLPLALQRPALPQLHLPPLCWLLVCKDTGPGTIHPHWKYHFSATPTAGHTSFSTHREPSRETRAAGEGFHGTSMVLILLVFLSLWSPHPQG